MKADPKGLYALSPLSRRSAKGTAEKCTCDSFLPENSINKRGSFEMERRRFDPCSPGNFYRCINMNGISRWTAVHVRNIFGKWENEEAWGDWMIRWACGKMLRVLSSRARAFWLDVHFEALLKLFSKSWVFRESNCVLVIPRIRKASEQAYLFVLRHVCANAYFIVCKVISLELWQ